MAADVGARVMVRARRSPVPAIIVGVAGLALAGFMYVRANFDVERYNADPSCAPAAGAIAARSGQCRLEAARIARFYRSTGRSRQRYLVVALADGSSARIAYGFDRYGDVWRAVTRAGERSASVQFFRGDIVSVQTASGLVTTAKMPATRRGSWAIVGLIAGVLGMIGAAVQYVRISRGWA